MADALLLEWEGVLVDTAAMRAAALGAALEAEGVVMVGSRGSGAEDHADAERAVARALAAAGRADDLTLQEIVVLRARREFLQRVAQGVSLAPGAGEFVHACGHRARIVIVTAAGRTETEQLIREAGWEDAVSSVIAADDFPADAGWAERVQRALSQLAQRGTRASDAILVGRCTDAFRAARAAGVRSLAVGAPAHVAVDADGAVATLDGLGFDDVARLARGVALRDSP